MHRVAVDSAEYVSWHDRSSRTTKHGPGKEVESTPGVEAYVGKAPNTVHSTTSAALDHGTPHSQSFNMIASGTPIEGIRDIPDTVLVGQASSTAARERKKPWERER